MPDLETVGRPARSRVAILESAEGQFELVHEKLNVGRRAESLRLQWTEHGILEPVEAPAEMSAGTTLAYDCARVLEALREAISDGASVTTARLGSSTTWHALKSYQTLPLDLQSASGKHRFWAAITRLQRDGRIIAESYQTPHRKQSERWSIPAAAVE